MAMDGDGQHNDKSPVMDSGTGWQRAVQGQFDGEGLRVGNTMTIGDENGANTTAMSKQPTMEAKKANAASKH